MKVLQRYFAAEIVRAIVFVLLAFLALLTFLDLIGELKFVGVGGYRLQHAFIYLLLRIPGHVYVLMPVAALLGSIWTLAQFAERSEFTIMRVSSMSTWQAAGILFRIGLVFVVLTFVFGEFVVPRMSTLAESTRLRAQGGTVSQEFRSGLWAKDMIKDNGLTGKPLGTRFINVREVRADGELRGIRLYEFDPAFRLVDLVTAASATYGGGNVWDLSEVTETHFSGVMLDGGASLETAKPISVHQSPSMRLVSEITPAMLSVLFADPERMSASDLAAYTRHLAENNQRTEVYEIAFWKKLVYPFAVLVMMALSLPFAYLHVRAGGVSLKIFVGIMIGVSFLVLNSLFAHLGLLKAWPPFATAILPSLLFMLLAVTALTWIEWH